MSVNNRIYDRQTHYNHTNKPNKLKSKNCNFMYTNRITNIINRCYD